jgi:hypothetical protein
MNLNLFEIDIALQRKSLRDASRRGAIFPDLGSYEGEGRGGTLPFPPGPSFHLDYE